MKRTSFYFLLLALVVVVGLLFLLRGPAEVAVASAVIGAKGGNLSCDDGRVLVAVPEGALEKETTITCEAAPVDELPEALKELAVVGQPYRLGPEGITFEKPVTLKVALDSSLYNVTANKTEVAPPILLTVNGKGEAEPLQGQRVVVGPGETYIEGNTSHFSTVVKSKGTLQVRLTPGKYSLPPYSLFDASVSVINVGSLEYFPWRSGLADLIVDRSYAVYQGSVRAEDRVVEFKLPPNSGKQLYFNYFCREGIGKYGFSMRYSTAPQGVPELAGVPKSLDIWGDAKCKEKTTTLVEEVKGFTFGGGDKEPGKVVKKGQIKVKMTPKEITLPVGETFTVKFDFMIPITLLLEEDAISILRIKLTFFAEGSVSIGRIIGVSKLETLLEMLPTNGDWVFWVSPGQSKSFSAQYVCSKVGEGKYGADINIAVKPVQLSSQYIENAMKFKIEGEAECKAEETIIEENATTTGVTIGTPGNRSCFYEGEQATFGAYDPMGNPVEVSWSSEEFGISQTGSSLSYSFGAPGSGIITATVGGVTTSIPVTVHKLPEEAGDYETKLSADIKGKSGEVYTFSPIEDAGGNALYDSLYLFDSGPPARLRFGRVLAGPGAGGVFVHEGKDYLITSSENLSMDVAPATITKLPAYGSYDPAAAMSIGGGFKAQYVVSDGKPRLHLTKDTYQGFAELEPSETAYEITSKVMAVSKAAEGWFFWVTGITSKELELAVAARSDVMVIEDGGSAFGWAWVKVNDPDFPHYGLSGWKEEETLPRGEKKFIPGASRTLIEYTMTGEIAVKYVKKPPC
jgi:hypothetical protein